jgi:hypothetical protein
MPRSNRRRSDEPGEETFAHLLSGWKRTETRRGANWVVQPVSADRAGKVYVCPGCARSVEPGVAHLVVWRADGVLGDQADLSGRRHWHPHCWKVA